MSEFDNNQMNGIMNLLLEMARRAAAPEPEPEPLRFVVFGDSKGKDQGINEGVLMKIINIIKKMNPQPRYIIVLGDITAGSEKVEKQRFLLQRFKQLATTFYPPERILPVLGNHEVANNPPDDANEKIFKEVFSEFIPNGQMEGYNKTVYYIDYGNSRLIFLNAHHFGELNRVGDKQLEWFKKTVSEQFDHKFVFIHLPPYPTGAHLGNCLDMHAEYRDRLWKLIDEHNVDIVFSGHEHNYSRRIIDNSFSTEQCRFNRGTCQIITGGAGEKLKGAFKSKKGVVVPPKEVHHFVAVDVNGSNISVQSMSADGRMIDKFMLGK